MIFLNSLLEKNVFVKAKVRLVKKEINSDAVVQGTFKKAKRPRVIKRFIDIRSKGIVVVAGDLCWMQLRGDEGVAFSQQHQIYDHLRLEII